MRECPTCRRCFTDDINHCPDDGAVTNYSIAGEPVLDSRYQLERRLGHGGMGVVFQAKHIFLKTSHAIKVILPDLVGNDPMLVTRFRQEALAAAAIKHPNIISVTDFGVVRGVMPFLVMEFVKGISLHDLLAQEKRLSPTRAIEIISAVGAGVGAAHRQNIVHRDLKPLNIMIQDSMTIPEGLKVLDFGLAKIKSGELLGSFVQAKTSGLMGSPFYMAPEQWSDEEPDIRADIYSIGVILYQMLAGEVPFRGNSIPAIMKKHLTEEAPPFESLDLQVSPAIEQVIRRALAKDPKERWGSVDEMVRALRESVIKSAAAYPNAVTMPIGQANVRMDQTLASTSFPGSGKADATLFVHSFPPQSRVFINNVSVGETDQHGLLVVPQLLRGEHQVVVLHDGFREWSDSVACNGGDLHVEARLAHEKVEGEITGTIGASSLSDSAYPAQSATSAPVIGEPEAPVAEQGADSPGPVSIAQSGAHVSVNEGVIPDRETEEPSSKEHFAGGVDEPVSSQVTEISIAPAQDTSVGFSEMATQSFGALGSFGGTVAPPVSAAETQHLPVAPVETVILPQAEHSAPGISSSRIEIETRAELTNSATNVVPSVVAAPPKRGSSVVYIAGAAVLVLLLAAGGGFLLFRNRTANVPAPPQQAEQPQQAPPAPVIVTPELVVIPGGSFQMGSSKGLPQEAPAHQVTVDQFMMDKTEVTNAEYAQFIQSTNRQPPADWNGNKPPEGQELLPVTGVSLEDANSFAAWRSQRDGTSYRLPTEAEWEFAARNGGQADNYPWGDIWSDDRANLTKVVKPVGSYSSGQNKWGVMDLIGNVWEWTSSKIELYPASPSAAPIPAEQSNWIVIRGGSHSSESSGPKAVSSFKREWVEPGRKDGKLGFRLVRSTQ